MDSKKFAGPMTLEERNALTKFQDLLDETDIDYEDYDDNDLTRFLRARKLDLPKVWDMFKAFLDWREKEKVNEAMSVFINFIILSGNSLNISN